MEFDSHHWIPCKQGAVEALTESISSDYADAMKDSIITAIVEPFREALDGALEAAKEEIKTWEAMYYDLVDKVAELEAENLRLTQEVAALVATELQS